jgi:hypothetical protein
VVAFLSLSFESSGFASAGARERDEQIPGSMVRAIAQSVAGYRSAHVGVASSACCWCHIQLLQRVFLQWARVKDKRKAWLATEVLLLELHCWPAAGASLTAAACVVELLWKSEGTTTGERGGRE